MAFYFYDKNKKLFNLNGIEESLQDIQNGKMIIVVDDENRENEGDFIVAAEKITPKIVNFLITHGRGLVCVSLTEERCDQLELTMMVKNNTDPRKTAFTVSVDVRGYGVRTGISVFDRAKTILALVHEENPESFNKPGHIFPIRAKKGGVLERPGHTEAAIDITRLSGCIPGGVLVEILNKNGSMARLPQLIQMAKKFHMKIISIENLIQYHKEAS
ncbi:3,4-dihydroxy-2-butanone-4-phosphate synthase [Blattabacterium sp. (Cryptocercus punctulatus) str. Cpu]|uniref:3,4-dihydroxy-2-butanone-4-phosphate synthase n=1 Tax=Blattabacterium sp. (Cryptocercus punctulatus) str. Cpu TaxID=1075399 RepID=UPI000238730B|nr:3,4-dihydroxy-2-butanone-4-phosphate synthase [Blattabacterium sp. (Cryptocercus punctulatus) str. Cpu]AEU09350.1 bifunctional 3,4 dihydroxy-2-butanone-4-phosphate synthase, GTP cyclohydrolase II [Blattabacterium sp. (Cryptocercus punctulatus) str. Cpu]